MAPTAYRHHVLNAGKDGCSNTAYHWPNKGEPEREN